MIFVFTNNNLFLSEKYSSLVRISYKIYIRIKLLSINKKDIYIYIYIYIYARLCVHLILKSLQYIE